MSVSGGASTARNRRGENRFYNPPPMRRQQQQQQQQMAMKMQQQEEKPSISKSSTEKRTDREEWALSYASSSLLNNSNNNDKDNRRNDDNSSNLDRFLEFSTPVVPVQYFPKTSSIRGWRGKEQELRLQSSPYFVLEDLWESFKEWSAYGAGVPLLLNGSDSVMQYYVPYLSGIQLYVDPLRPSTRLRRPGEDSDTESSRETSSDGSNSDCVMGRRANNVVQGAQSQLKVADPNIEKLMRLSLRNRSFGGSSSDENDSCNPPGQQLIFEYLEHDQPFSREPLADKIAVLASRFPLLKTYRSCDLSPSSWVSVAWYPIYRIPMGPTLQNLDACFLTYHSLSTPPPGTGVSMDRFPFRGFNVREFHGANMSLKIPLPTFGLSFYKFKVSFWNPDEVNESKKANSLLRAADNWLRLLQVNHPDFRFFVSHNTYWR
ncbi:uncharacterized protein LOC120206651 isoform X1 [Hibiscus syriacus]|uniref:uncharacterized protein LOC120206651 isoform X1 n=1 Tax=Hibiscus syriacus TaxID=106335 RepID=UPI001922990D|nr:uncharacterized protein LOC120206651 isoform X1 [Hibiscus syriacus]